MKFPFHITLYYCLSVKTYPHELLASLHPHWRKIHQVRQNKSLPNCLNKCKCQQKFDNFCHLIFHFHPFSLTTSSPSNSSSSHPLHFCSSSDEFNSIHIFYNFVTDFLDSLEVNLILFCGKNRHHFHCLIVRPQPIVIRSHPFQPQ